MIELYSGTPGSGKSYHAIQRILSALRFGKLVIANFPMKFTSKEIKKGYEDRFFYLPNEKITIDSLLTFALDHGLIEKKQENQCIVVIDEAGGRFNCRDFKNSDRAEWIDFFSQHRKIGYTFILVAQADRMIDRQIRSLVETEYKHRKVNNFGVFWIFTLFKMTVFVSVEYWYSIKQRVGSEFVLFRKSVADHYDSMQMFSGFQLSKELLKRIEDSRKPDSAITIEVPASQKVPITAVFNDSD